VAAATPARRVGQPTTSPPRSSTWPAPALSPARCWMHRGAEPHRRGAGQL